MGRIAPCFSPGAAAPLFNLCVCHHSSGPDASAASGFSGLVVHAKNDLLIHLLSYVISFYFTFTFYCFCVITCIFLSTILVNKDE